MSEGQQTADSYIKELEERVKELERDIDIAKNETKELRSLHDAGIKEVYRLCGVEDDGEYRWKWVLLELSSRIYRIKKLEVAIEKHRDAFIIMKDGRPRYNSDIELYKVRDEKETEG